MENEQLLQYILYIYTEYNVRGCIYALYAYNVILLLCCGHMCVGMFSTMYRITLSTLCGHLWCCKHYISLKCMNTQSYGLVQAVSKIKFNI